MIKTPIHSKLKYIEFVLQKGPTGEALFD